MKYFRISGGDVFPFSLPKITTRDVRLLERSTAPTAGLAPGAEQNLRAVQAECARWAAAFGANYSTQICLHTKTACVDAFLPLWTLRHCDREVLLRLRPHLCGITVSPFGFGLKIVFKVKYFHGAPCRIDQELACVFRDYTEK